MGNVVRAGIRSEVSRIAAAAALAIVFWTGQASAATYRWNADTDGNWTDAGNWTLTSGTPNGLGYPNAIDDVAELTDAITADRIVTIPDGVTITLGGLVLDDDNNYRITTGTGLLVFENTATPCPLTVSNASGDGAHTIAVPVQLNHHLEVTITSSGTLTFTRHITQLMVGGFRNLSIAGGGTVRFAPDIGNTYLGDTTVLAGTLELAGPQPPVTQPMIIGGGAEAATVTLLADDQFSNNPQVTVASNGVLDLDGHNARMALTVTAGAVTIGTATLTSHGPLSMTGGSITSTGAGQLMLAGTVVAFPSSATATITGTVNLDSGTMISAQTGPAEPDLIIDGRIIGGAFVKGGSGTVRLTGTGDNTMTQASATDGLLELAKPSGISISGPFAIGNGSVIDGLLPTVSVSTNEQIADASTVEVRVDGDLLINGTNNIETISSLTITQGQVAIGAAHLIVGNLSMTGGTTIPIGATGELTIANSLTTASTGPGMAITGGRLNLGAGGTRTFNIGNINNVIVDFDVTSIITGSATLSKTGGGMMRSSGVNTFNGATSVAAGQFIVNGTHPSAVTLAGGLLGGAGTIGGLSGGGTGTVSPGEHGPLAGVTAALRSGSISLSSNVTFFAEMNGTTPGVHDQLAVTGSVTLNNTPLVIDFPGIVSPATVVKIIDNDGSDPVAGTFAGLAEGVKVDDEYYITYTGGDGNDVVLHLDAPPTMSLLGALQVDEDPGQQSVNFTIGDDYTDAADLVLSAHSNNQALVADAGLTFTGSGTARTLQFTPAANAHGNAFITVRVTDERSQFLERELQLTVNGLNDTPTFSPIGPQTIVEDGALNLPFTVEDVDTPLTDVGVSASSGNQSLVQWSSIAVTGTGANRMLSLTPVGNAHGQVTITLSAGDGVWNTQHDFVLTITPVNDAPEIAVIGGPITIAENTGVPLPIFLNDIDDPPFNVSVTASSSNQQLVRDVDLVVTGGPTTRTLNLTPVFGAHGQATITLTASDGLASSQRAFDLIVTNVNAAPTISAIAPQTINEDTSLAPVTFTVADVDNDAAALTVTAASSNQALVPDANLTVVPCPACGIANAWTIAATPIANAFGTTTITVTVSDGTAQASTAFVLTVNNVAEPTDPPPPPITYILAEGATGGFFDTDLLIANPNSAAAPITLTFLKQDGATAVFTRTVAAQRHMTIHVDELTGLEATAAATTIRSDAGLPLAVERTMFWNESRYGGHTDAAVPGPSRTWVFGEGAQGFFDTYLLIANPNSDPANLTLTFLREGEAPFVATRSVGGLSRLTIHAAEFPELHNRSFGIAVEATQPVNAERATYFATTPSRLWSGGQASAGVAQPSRNWFLAEGATGTFFDTFILLGNPGDTPANVDVQFLLDTGEAIGVTRQVPARGRVTIPVDMEPDPRVQAASLSTVVSSDVPIVAERSMYWPTGEALSWGEAHHAVGLTGTATRWALAEGRVGGAFSYVTYILLANPSSTPANVNITFLRENGTPIVRPYTVQPTSRVTVDVGGEVTELQNELFGAAIEVTNGVGIAVERAMYWTSNGIFLAGGTGATATRLP